MRDQMYAPFGIRPRAKGQRRDRQDLIPGNCAPEVGPGFFFMENPMPAGWSAKVIGPAVVAGEQFESVVVTSPQGLNIPAWRRGPGFCVCQSTEYKAGRVSS